MAGNNVEANLCELLGIDVEGIAYRLAMEEFGDVDDASSDANTRMLKSTFVSSNEDFPKPNMEQDRSNLSDHDHHLEQNSIRLCQLMESNSDCHGAHKTTSP